MKSPLLACLVLLAVACGEGRPSRCVPGPGPTPPPPSPGPTGTFEPIERFVVIYLENRSFDHLYGELEGVEGLGAATTAPPQVDRQGRPYQVLPAPRDGRFPLDLPNAPFAIDQFVAPDQLLSDLVHRFYQAKLQINGGRMDRFAQVSDARGLTMGFFHTAGLPLAALAREFTVCDHFFSSAFGGSFLNHQFLIAAAAPVWEDAPSGVLASVNAQGELLYDGAVTVEGCQVVNTAYGALAPRPRFGGVTVPLQHAPTIGDRLTAKGVSWGWYAGGWNAAVAGRPEPFFQYHHQPFLYYAAYASSPARDHLQDEEDFLAAARDGTLPAVSFVKPLVDEHPGYSTVIAAETHALALVQAVRAGPQWPRTAIIITYDENGGFWDHLAPPPGDALGPGVRVPTLIVSPYARRGFVDRTAYETMSILATIEHRFGLDPLTNRDASARDLAAAFDFSQ
jgi:phospholipase C